MTALANEKASLDHSLDPTRTETRVVTGARLSQLGGRRLKRSLRYSWSAGERPRRLWARSVPTSLMAMVLMTVILTGVGVGRLATAAGSGNDLLPDPQFGSLQVRLDLVTTIPGSSVIDIAGAGDGSGRLFLVAPSGQIRIYQGGSLLGAPFLDAPASPPDRAMSSVAFHPDFVANGKVYVVSGEAVPNGTTPHYSAPQDDSPSAFDNILCEYLVDPLDPNQIDPTTRRELLRVHQSHRLHNMSDLAFGADGTLYVGMGDGGQTGLGVPTPHQTTAQQLDNPFGAILRLDVDAIGPNGRYAIPPTNPFPNGAVPEIFAWGMRNPWRLSVDRLTGEVYTGVNGDITVEQVIRVQNGANYGWPIREGSFLWNPLTSEATVDPNPDPAITAPLAEYDHNWLTRAHGSIIGGSVYRGTQIPGLIGRYVFLDWLAGDLFIVDLTSGVVERVSVDSGGVQLTPTDAITWGEDDDGELYIGTSSGMVLRVVGVDVAFVRGDANGDGAVNLADVVLTLAYLFQATATSCLDALDLNDDGGLDISDPVFALGHQFSAGYPPFPPYPGCGPDPTADGIGCLAFAACP